MIFFINFPTSAMKKRRNFRFVSFAYYFIESCVVKFSASSFWFLSKSKAKKHLLNFPPISFVGTNENIKTRNENEKMSDFESNCQQLLIFFCFESVSWHFHYVLAYSTAFYSFFTANCLLHLTLCCWCVWKILHVSDFSRCESFFSKVKCSEEIFKFIKTLFYALLV